MKFLPLLFRNITRKWTRLLLTIGSFAIALFLFGILAVVNNSFNGALNSMAGVDRLMVQNRVSIIQPVPEAYKAKIEQIEHVKLVTYANWFGAVYQDEKNFFPQYAIDEESYRKMYPEFRVADAEWKAWEDDREGVIVGEKTAEKYGFKVGDRVPLKGVLWGGGESWSFNVRGIYHAKPDEDQSQFWLHWKLFDERRQFSKGTVGWYIVRVDSPDNAVEVSKKIDAMFANSSTETKTQTEKEMMASWAKQTGNVGLIITIIGSVVFFTLLLVVGNTMAMSIRERMRELAVLKAIGYTDRFVLVFVIAESVVVAFIGVAIGLGLLLLSLPGIEKALSSFLQFVFLPPQKAIEGVVITLFIAFLAGIIPAVNASRLRVVDAIRRV
ncbi:ABC efflux pump, inner membrane subunit [Candidatus Koribacter versatilis Ellin345]|uniref:ABC efflux pump, inner membrane subunit n=1 Tax=Koribacter versatilis (strain Ellin345) TaxID=204669 RepID=Q1IR79_KORVE|nr:FtsX-like permease family protein [Candidatus Koribacter versatilis]ABF40621.1 ABC efflux pump, inner membrane subunit [Candidatus Koribacter versatilis Ellin345]